MGSSALLKSDIRSLLIKIVVALILMALILAIAPQAAQAKRSTKIYEFRDSAFIYYSISGNEATIEGVYDYKHSSISFEVPQTIKGKKVTALKFTNLSDGEESIYDSSFEDPSFSVAIDATKATYLKSASIESVPIAIPKLDVSGLPALKTLSINGQMWVKELDASGCSNLGTVTAPCSGNCTVDVSDCPKLKKLNCRRYYGEDDNDAYLSVNLSGCAGLETLVCDEISLSSLDVSDCTSLKTLSITQCDLPRLDISKCSKLEVLRCTGQRPSFSVSVQNTPNLKELRCNYYQVPGFGALPRLERLELKGNVNQSCVADIEKLVHLKELRLFNSFIRSLDLSKMSDLEILDISAAYSLKGFSLGNWPKLKYLDCTSTELSNYDFSKYPLLEVLKCSETNISVLDLSNSTMLEELECFENRLTVLKLAKCPKLESIDCYDNMLTALDVSGCPKLEYLDCSGNQITYLDLSKNHELAELFKDSNCKTLRAQDYASFSTYLGFALINTIYDTAAQHNGTKRISKSGVRGKAKCTFSAKIPSKLKKYISVSSDGKVTVKKGLKRGDHYITVTMKIAPTDGYVGKTITRKLCIGVV